MAGELQTGNRRSLGVLGLATSAAWIACVIAWFVVQNGISVATERAAALPVSALFYIRFGTLVFLLPLVVSGVTALITRGGRQHTTFVYACAAILLVFAIVWPTGAHFAFATALARAG